MAASVAYGGVSVMASRVRPSSTPGLPRISALTVLLEAQRMKSITHRMIYVARITPGQAHRRDIPDHCERLFHRLIKSNLGESISGLLLLYPGCVIHMIEASSEILSGINQDLIQIQGPNSLLQDIRILVISHNIRSRLLPQWYFHTVTLPTQYLGDVGSGLSETVVEECLTLMLKLGVFLSQILSLNAYICAAWQQRSGRKCARLGARTAGQRREHRLPYSLRDVSHTRKVPQNV
ncbi:testis-expressed protein 47-like isoform X2 [Ranitomeya imitator]|uniref:testis-expressed protein 47-like isoform X2 n=1 Tax=Ranitomeya imitator TaxID=111125 RepID=UPI0037E9B583